MPDQNQQPTGSDTITPDALSAARERVAAYKAQRAAKRKRIEDARAEAKLIEQQRNADAARLQAENRRHFMKDLGLNALDLPESLLRGAAYGLSEIPGAIADLGDSLERHVPLGGFTFDRHGIHYVRHLLPEHSVLRKTTEGADKLIAMTGKPRTGAGELTQGVGQFLSVFLPVAGEFKIAEAGRLAELGTHAAAGAVADFTVFDPAQKNLSALIQEHPKLHNPVTQFLATDPRDSGAANRLRNSLEGLGLGATIDTFVESLRVLRNVRAARAHADVKAGREEAKQIKLGEHKPAPKPEPAAAAPEQPGATPPAAPEVQPPATPSAPSAPNTVPPQGAAKELAQRITKGSYSSAKGLTDFNADTINWDSLGENPDEIRKLINTVSDSLAPTIDKAKGGVQPLKETARLAELVGGKPDEVRRLFEDVRGGAGLAARVQASERILLASGQRLRDLAVRVRDEGGHAAEQELLQHTELHGAIQASVKGSKTEIARALHAMRQLKQAAATSVDDFQEAARIVGEGRASRNLVKKLASADNLDELNRLNRKTRYQRWRDAALEVWINGLLTAPTTHAVNAASNAVKALALIPEKSIAAGIGGVRRHVFGQAVEGVDAGEAAQVAFGLVRGLGDALRLPGLQTLKKLGAAGVQSVRAWDATAAKQVIEQNKAEFGNVYRAIAEGSQIDQASKLEVNRHAIYWNPAGKEGAARVAAHATNFLGHVVRAPGSALTAGDELFKTIAYRQELQALALRTAKREAREVGLKGMAKAEAVSKRYAELLAKPPEELHLAAVDQARVRTFTQPLGETGRKLQGILAQVPLMRFIVPFFRTPANLLKDAVGHSPLMLTKLIKKEFRQQLARGGAEADMVISRMLMGSALVAEVWHLADAGLLKGGGNHGHPTSQDQAPYGMSQVNPYSVKIGSKWYVYNRLDPLGMLLGATADLHDMIANDPDPKNPKHKELFELIAIAAAKNITSKTWLSGVSELVNAASDPERYGPAYLRRFGASAVPFSALLRHTAGAEDPYAREVFSFSDQLRANTPGLSKTAAVRRDWLGRPVKSRLPFISPIAVSTESKDPLDRELVRLQFHLPMPRKSIEGIRLDAHEYSRLLELRGQHKFSGKSLEDVLQKFIQSDEYKALPENPDPSVLGTKEDAIKRLASKYLKAAKEQLLKEDSKLADEVNAEKARRHALMAQSQQHDHGRQITLKDLTDTVKHTQQHASAAMKQFTEQLRQLSQ